MGIYEYGVYKQPAKLNALFIVRLEPAAGFEQSYS